MGVVLIGQLKCWFSDTVYVSFGYKPPNVGGLKHFLGAIFSFKLSRSAVEQI